ncbi:MAG: MoaD/ThiS family protein [Ferroplasma sp.]|uniref:MoaD/ThiS family protein n=1 Tax=Ferroplasma sp. TaxID=2591003 RepID=UPI00281602C7|nr:MoaD/ThiS family protein [Ferroplasma sp.]WMT51571.1 MAG: MoaD/ThiS family protein [Ferroplasma sp.]
MIEVVGRKKEKIRIEKPVRLSELYDSMGINEDGFVAILNGVPATSDHIINPDDNLILLEIFSGG